MDPELRQEALIKMEAVEQALRDADKVWSEHVVHAQVYPVDIFREIKTRAEIGVALKTDGLAKAEARGALLKIQWDSSQGQHHGTTARFPGVVFLDTPPSPLFARINQAKEELEEFFKRPVFPKNNKARLYKDLYENVSMLQATRRVYCYDYRPRKVGFTWAGKVPSIRRYTYQELVEYLDSTRRTPPDKYSSDDWSRVIDIELEKANQIYNSPGSQVEVVRRRFIAPHPRVNVYQTSTRKPEAVHMANLPVFFYMGEGEEQPPPVNPLETYQQTFDGKKQSTRADTVPVRPFIEPLKLYVRPRPAED